MQSTRSAPRISDMTIAFIPTGPEPSTRTVSPIFMSPRSTACSEVGKAQPPAMKVSGSASSLMQRVPGLMVDVRGPSAAESVIEAVRDAINFSLRAARSGFRDEAIPAGVARAMNVEKRDAVAFTETVAFDVEQLAANLLQTAD